MNISLLSCDSFGPRLTQEVQSMHHCFRYEAQSTAMTKTIKASEVAHPGSLLDGRALKMHTRHQCCSGADTQKRTGSLLLQVPEKPMQPSLGKDPEDEHLSVVLFLPSFPAWGALAWPDITTSPVRETSSNGACPPGLLLMHFLSPPAHSANPLRNPNLHWSASH